MPEGQYHVGGHAVVIKTKFKCSLLVVASYLTVSLLAGCSKSDGSGNGKIVANEEIQSSNPVTIRVHLDPSFGDDAIFKDLFIDPVKAKYPHITLERVLPVKGETAELLAASQNIPDIIFGAAGLWKLEYSVELGLAMDLTELAKKHKVNLNRFRPGMLEAHSSADGKQVFGIPFSLQYYGTFYNKDIFDKFGVSYPKDGMLWSDAIDLAKKLTRLDAETQYLGLHWGIMHRASFPLSLITIDPKTNKASANTDGWRKVFQLGRDIYSIPGNNTGNYDDGFALFTKGRRLAMLTDLNWWFARLLDQEGKDLNWDVAQFPSYPERPNTFGIIDVQSVTIPKSSKHKDEAFLVANLLGSEEVQLKLVRKYGKFTPLADTNQKYSSQVGADIPQLKGKNMKSIFKSDYAPFNPIHTWEAKGMAVIMNKFTEVMKGKDINTALREADEEINKTVLMP